MATKTLWKNDGSDAANYRLRFAAVRAFANDYGDNATIMVADVDNCGDGLVYSINHDVAFWSRVYADMASNDNTPGNLPTLREHVRGLIRNRVSRVKKWPDKLATMTADGLSKSKINAARQYHVVNVVRYVVDDVMKTDEPDAGTMAAFLKMAPCFK